MHVGHWRISESALQKYLPWRVEQQVFATNDMRYALQGIVHDHCQLIGIETVGASQDEIAHFIAQVLTDGPASPISKCNWFFC